MSPWERLPKNGLLNKTTGERYRIVIVRYEPKVWGVVHYKNWQDTEGEIIGRYTYLKEARKILQSVKQEEKALQELKRLLR